MPLLSPPPPPPSAPGSGRRRLGRSRRSRSKRAENRNWAELPLDAMLHVLHKLDHLELMFGGASRVCRSWHCAARKEPVLWRRIDIRDHSRPRSRRLRETISFNRMARLSIWYSAGQCEEFYGEHDVDDDLLLLLADKAPSLKSLHLIHCNSLHSVPFAEALKKFPLLEELVLVSCPYIYVHDTSEVLELVAAACPQLKHLKMHFQTSRRLRENKAALAIAGRHELRSLQLLGDKLDNKGLTTILDNCPHLESLDMRYRY